MKDNPPPDGSQGPAAAPERPSSLHILRKSYAYLGRYRRQATGAYLLLLGITGLAIAIPQLVRWIVDRGIRGGEQSLLAWSVVALLGLTLVRGVLAFLQGRWTEIASQGVAYDLRNDIHEKLAGLSFSYHDRAQTGQLLSRAVQDVERIRFLTGRATLRLAEGATLLLGTAVALAWMNPRLALLTLAFIPLLAWIAYRFGREFRPLSLKIQDQLAVLTTRVEQNLRGARIVKAFAQEEAEVDRFEQENGLWFRLSTLAARLRAINVPLIDLVASLGTVVVIWYGGSLVIRGALTLGELVAFSTYLAQLVQPVRRMGMIIPAVAMAASA
ncbi:MAG TPA: ABC transporter ATP-binding protein, partial [Anaerolineae bacterium]|nr:ABC transporter ATP-binding protein [Anaerolineae bacterium]